MTLDAVIDHLWQSSLMAAAIALLTLAFRRAQAQTRYWLWFAASLKFLIPFAALASLGAHYQWREALPAARAEWTFILETAGRPLLWAHPVEVVLPRALSTADGLRLPLLAAAIWGMGCATVLVGWRLRWRRVSAAIRAGTPLTSGPIHDTLTELGAPATLPLVASATSFEPGVFGIVRPVLLWPRDIATRLDDAQVRAILAHELTHVRRRDNLTALVHTIVEALFWFHPLVWWIGARLVDEREQACDEEVVLRGSEPHVYAESILRTCQFYVESPLSCVPGVTGSNLKKRIERIMAHRPATVLGTWSRRLLVTTAAMTLAVPVAIGALSVPPRSIAVQPAPAVTMPLFKSWSITVNSTGAPRVTMRVTPDGAWDAANVTLESMIRLTYHLQESQLMGGPAWIYTDRFDIQARTEPGVTPGESGLRMQSLLNERFNLKLHRETRELPIYALVLATSAGTRGRRLTPAAVDCVAFARNRAAVAPAAPLPTPPQPGEPPTCGTLSSRGRLTGSGVTMEQLASTLSQYTGRMVVDRTTLSGGFDYELRFAHDPALRGRGPGGGLPLPAETTGSGGAGDPSIFAAVQEQLGLKLDAQRAFVDVLVIDSVEKPTEN